MEINALLGAFEADPRETRYQREVFRVVLRDRARVPGRREGMKLISSRDGCVAYHGLLVDRCPRPKPPLSTESPGCIVLLAVNRLMPNRSSSTHSER